MLIEKRGLMDVAVHHSLPGVFEGFRREVARLVGDVNKRIWLVPVGVFGQDECNSMLDSYGVDILCKGQSL